VPPKKDLVRYREVRLADMVNDQKSAAQILNAEAASITQEQYQEFILSQIKRIIHGNHPGIWKDDFLAEGILDLQDLSLGQDAFIANCLPSDILGAAVRITGPYLLGLAQVTTCDITVVGGYPAVGLISAKINSVTCVVQTHGPIPIAGLTPGATYFVGFNGQPAAAPLPPSITGRAAVQSIGIAIDTGTLQLSVTPNRFVRSL
jgi:hypothetical protein